MYRINFKRTVAKTINLRIPIVQTYSNIKLTPYHQIIIKHGCCNQASFLPWAVGVTAVGISLFGISFHYSKSFRKALKSYLSVDVQTVLDAYLGPNNDTFKGKKLENVSFMNKISWFSTYFIKSNEEDKFSEKGKTAFRREKDLRKMAEQGSDTEPSEVTEEINQLNIEFTSKTTKLLTEFEAMSKSTIVYLVDLESKINEHSKKLKVAIEDDGTSKDSLWDAANAVSHQQQIVKVKSENEMKKLHILTAKLEDLKKIGLQSETLHGNPSIKLIEETIANTNGRISQLQADIEKAQLNALLTNQYKELIQQGRERLKQELSSLNSNVSSWANKETAKLSNEDLNTLIIHAHRRVYQLQSRIADLESLDKIRLAAALSEQRKLHDEVTVQRTKNELDELIKRMGSERKVELEDLKKHGETSLRQALTRQATAHSEHLTQLLMIQREEIEKQQSLTIREALIREREKMSAAIEGWRRRVEGMEAAVEGRADQERLSRESQDLWVACHALQGLLDQAQSTPPLARYLASFEEAAQPDSLPTVRLLLKSVPEVAVEEGVCTQDVLTTRFEKMKRVCRRVAMVSETGGDLGLYALSYLRSLFLVSPTCLIGPETLVDLVHPCLDTNQVLASADLAIRIKDVALAVRLLNLLRGMPRAVAHDWIEDARTFLETRMAAEALSSYASSKTAGSFLPEMAEDGDH